MRIPDLSIDRTNDGLIELEQQNGLDEPDRIQIHPLHLRHMAESLGLIREMSASEADALRMVDKLARRMALLHERIKQVHEWMWQNKDFDQCDINVEAWYVNATLDLSKEFQAEIEESRAVVTPRPASRSHATPSNAGEKPNGFPKANPAETQRVKKSGSAEQLEFGVGHE